MQYPPDPLAKLRPQLRLFRFLILLHTFLVEPFRILFANRPDREERWRRLLGHWGLYRPAGKRGDTLWLHAAAEGEIRVALALIQALPADIPIVMTTNERDPRVFQANLGERTEVAAFPLPFVFVVRRFVRHFSPRRLILVEATDPRPLLYLRMADREIPTAVVNGWVSEKWLRTRRPFLPLLDRIDLFGVKDAGDRDLLAGIGISPDRVHLTGELKLDTTAEPKPEIEAWMQELAGGRPILIAGSTHRDEEPQILDAFERLGGGGRALLVLAPRNPFHCGITERLLRKRGIEFVRRSRLPVSGRPAVVLLDTTGELAALFRIAAAAFVGSSLTPAGTGRNPIEPARFGIPIATGPYMENFKFHADLFDRAGAWQRVADAEELAQVWSSWLDDPELGHQIGRRAADLVESQRGLALSRTLDMLRPFLGLEDRGTV